jgi:purine-binding chemotaxis protein CheW
MMFNLPVPDEEKSVEDGLILRLDSNQIGVIVDQIDKVVGISSASIQPPHPIFGDINIKYISGVVENEGRLYIILDVERVFSQDEHPPAERSVPVERTAPAQGSAATGRSAPAEETAAAPRGESAPSSEEPAESAAGDTEQDLTFIAETLQAFRSFFVSDLNRDWVSERLQAWRRQRSESGKPVQLSDDDDAVGFLGPFLSPHTGEFWSDEFSSAVADVLSELPERPISVWNPGCGKGFETYSLAVTLRRLNPDRKIKIWASDKDLLSISTAPNLVFSSDEVPASHKPYVVEGKNGYAFTRDIKDLILFEYHDILHTNAVPEADVIMARDLLSYLSPGDQARVIEEFEEKLKQGGVLMLGKNERLPSAEGWSDISSESITAYKKQ